MPASKGTVLITGCSDGGLGAALSVAFHDAGFHVYATARNPSKMEKIASHGIETLTLDVLSDESIAACVEKVPSLDILVNNAGAGYAMAFSDMSLSEAKKLFDLNVWSCLAVTQVFLPLLVQSKGMIVNHTSSASVMAVPFQGSYNASKAAMAIYSATQRQELEPLGITVVDLKSGGVQSNIQKNNRLRKNNDLSLPKGSLYEPARETVEKALTGAAFAEGSEPADVWAKNVVHDLSKKTPPQVIWRGNKAGLVRILTALPFNLMDGPIKQRLEFDKIEKALRR